MSAPLQTELPPIVAGAHDEGSASKRQQILAGAARVFAADGYEGASMSRIAAEAAVSKGTLYNYYSSKAELFAAYIEGTCSLVISQVFDDLDHASPPDAVMKLVGTRMCTMLLSEQALLMHRMVVAEAAKFPALAETFFNSGPARAVAHLSSYLAQATKDGRLAIADTTFAAEQFFALIQTRLYLRRQLRLTDLPSQAQLDHVIDGAVRLFLRGYAPQTT